jgi:hypothetical protein
VLDEAAAAYVALTETREAVESLFTVKSPNQLLQRTLGGPSRQSRLNGSPTSDAATVDRFCARLREHVLANRKSNSNPATEEVIDDA